MVVSVLKWIVVVLCVLNAGYMAFDGSRALIKGDYIRPTSGEHAGQLGPWARVVSALGIAPESTFMKIVFVLWGLAGFVCATMFAFDLPQSGRLILAFNVMSLWYVGPGAALSVLQIILILVRIFAV